MFAHLHARSLHRGISGLVALVLVAAAADWVAAPAAEAPRRPNIVCFLADDLGYGDLGSFGQEKIRTPHLDRLASRGVRLTRHYAGNAVCAPSRCVLMTGLHPGHAYVRNNRSVGPEGQEPLPAGTQTLARLLHDHGYATGAFGKWGLGGPATSGIPTQQGYDRFCGYLCQGVAHNHYPQSLWSNEDRVPLENHAFSAHQKFPAGADPRDPAAFARYQGKDFAPDRITQAALEFVRAQRDRPFFLYVPTTIPHLALQVPHDSLAEYPAAWDDAPYLGTKGYLPHARPRAAYAAMITRMDRHMGEIIDLIDELGLTQDTIYVFSSDNGPLYDKFGGTDCEFFLSARDLRGRKGSLYEGGIRVPTFIAWQGKIAPGASDRLSGFEDWLPTLLDLAGLAEHVPAGLDGVSLAPALRGKEQPPRPFLYREFPAYGGQHAAWMGEWKGVRQNLLKLKAGEPLPPLELYNLETDPAESHNVANAHPEIVARLNDLLRREHTPSEVFPFAALDAAR